jgi:hypothetical protein
VARAQPRSRSSRRFEAVFEEDVGSRERAADGLIVRRIETGSKLAPLARRPDVAAGDPVGIADIRITRKLDVVVLARVVAVSGVNHGSSVGGHVVGCAEARNQRAAVGARNVARGHAAGAFVANTQIERETCAGRPVIVHVGRSGGHIDRRTAQRIPGLKPRGARHEPGNQAAVRIELGTAVGADLVVSLKNVSAQALRVATNTRRGEVFKSALHLMRPELARREHPRDAAGELLVVSFLRIG